MNPMEVRNNPETGTALVLSDDKMCVDTPRPSIQRKEIEGQKVEGAVDRSVGATQLPSL